MASLASRLEEVPFEPELQNRVTLTGNVGKLTLKRADDGHQQLFISLAINRPNSSTMWFDVCAWDQLAKLAASSLQVGAQIRVEGFIQALAPPPPNPAKYRVIARGIQRIARSGPAQQGDGSVRSGGTQAGKEQEEKLWMNFFENPSGPQRPALWVESSPDWVKTELQKLDAQSQPTDL
ncbi:hypothetical protein QBZ16_001777 [Prototheca wickerhamii]|uniref:Single-stranded DNA-binding protein n=1 Tax=Prototheca wickerhamii TaxID=3111 RepID=A0AAD9IEN1_PROWI|nr:hypothetical protein QBZ16_001777 [Prototheca wickerhamii]